MASKINTEKVITRFAPSPTGFFHVGSARTALFNHLFTAKNKGKSILRIEDTDKERSDKKFEADIIENLKWLNIPFAETVRQSDRVSVYQKYLQQLISAGFVYISKETPIDPGDRSEVIRFKNPNKKIKFYDLVRGEVEFDTTDLKDFVVAKSETEPIFHFANVIDDFEMGVTHVIRGEDHISNTPRQILLQEAIGAPRPIYAHIPLILADDRSKLSKRKHGVSVSLNSYKEAGYLPEAMNNFLALLGWNPGNELEIMSLSTLIEKFDMSRVHKGGAIFNIDKLKWLNKHYISSMSASDFEKEFKHWMKPEYTDDAVLKKITSVVQGRIEKFSDIVDMKKNNELDYFFNQPKYNIKKLIWKDSSEQKTKAHLSSVLRIVAGVNADNFTSDNLKTAIFPYAEKEGRGDVLWPLRYALSSQDKSPDPFFLASVLGKEETTRRIQNALNKLA